MASRPERPRWHRYLPRLLFLIPTAGALWVPFYNRLEPAIAGVPFFYWFQLTWIPVAALCVLVVYALEVRIARRT